MVSFCPLFSGSQGNSILISGSGATILVDAGVSAKRISAAVSSFGYDIKKIDALLLTHEHTDHVSGVRVINKYHSIATYATKGTLGGAFLEGDDFFAVWPLDDFFIGDVRVTPFPVAHDACEPVGYRFYFPKEDKVVAVVTDLGELTKEVYDMAIGSDLLYIESNHDVEMLKSGPYPAFLKRRILSGSGHLSNDDGAKIAADAAERGTKTIVLAHLSRNNNTPRMADSCARSSLILKNVDPDRDIELAVAMPESDGKKFFV